MKFSRPNNLKGLLLFAAAVLLLEFITYNYGGGKSCYLKGMAGVPCPGCGLTRSFISLFHGDFTKAFFYHPLFPLIPVLFIAIVYQKITRSRAAFFNRLYIGATILFIFVFIVRMLLYFPHTAPLDFNGKSVLMRGYHFIAQ